MFDEQGRRTGRVFARPYALSYGDDGAAELDGRTLRSAVRAALAHFHWKRRSPDRIASCAFWHGLIGLDKERRPLTPIYTWADARCRWDAERLRTELRESTILQRTGCMLRFVYWPAKLRWLRRRDRALFRRVRFWVSPADWVLHELFAKLATSESMASGTGLFNQQSRSWDQELCDVVGINPDQLPPIRDHIGGGKVLTCIGDGAASNLGCGATTKNIAAVNLGTSAAIRVAIDRLFRVPSGLFRYIINGNRFVFGGAMSNAGNVQAWCRRELRIPKSSRIDRQRAATDSLLALPFFAAERSPDWTEIPASIFGARLATTGAEVYRATTTSALYRLASIFDLLEQSVGRIDRIIVSGGMTKSPDILAILADALGRNLEIASESEASLRGAALHALEGNGSVLVGAKRGRKVRCNKTLTRKHRARRDKQQRFLRMVSAAD